MALTLALLEGVSIVATVLLVLVLRLDPVEVGWTGASTLAGQAFVLALCSVAIFYHSALYEPQLTSNFALFASRLPRSLAAILGLLVVVYTLFPGVRPGNDPFVWSLLWSAGIVIAPVLPLRAVSSAIGASGLFRERILILGLTPLAERLIREIQARPSGRRDVVGVVDDLPAAADYAVGCPILGPFRRLAEMVGELRPDRIVVALAERRGRTPVRALLESCVPRGVIVEDVTAFYERLTGKLAIESLTPTSIVFSKSFRPSRFQQTFARALSLPVAIIGLALSPLLALIALAIKLDSPGPVLFIQERVGAHGRPFKLLKFRTMHATRAPRSEWAGDNGDRVTRLGRWLRTFRLDELPQFINILRGEMNLVGPRPHPVSNFELFTLVGRNLNELTGVAIGYYALRSMVRPGLTGWAQVRYGYANNLEEEIEKLRFDLYYVKHVSAWLDFRILLETLKVLFSGHLPDGLPRTSAGAAVGPAGPPGFPGKLNRGRAA